MRLPAFIQRRLDRYAFAQLDRYLQQVPNSDIGQPQALPQQTLDLYDAFQKIPTAFRGVKVICDTAAALPITVYRRRRGSDEAIPDHPLAEMLNPKTGMPNPNATGFDLWNGMFTHQQLVGTGYLLKDRVIVRTGEPLELTMLRPDWMKIVPGKSEPIARYEYGPPDGSTVTLDPALVIPFPLVNPVHPFIGQSPLLPVRGTMILELYMVALNTGFFKNGATLGGVIMFDKGVQQNTMKQLMDAFRAQHQGADKAYRWRGVSGVQDMKELGLNNKDLQYYEGMKWTRENIATALGVPMVLLGVLDGATFANSKEQKAIFYESTIMPVTTIRDARINLHLAPAYGKDIYVSTDYSNVDALLPDMKLVVEAANAALRNNAVTFGEYRQWIQTRKTPTLTGTDRDDLYYSDVVSTPAFDQAGGPATGAANDAAPGGNAPRRAPRPPQTVESLLDEVSRAAAARAERELRETAKKKEGLIDARVEKVRPKMEKAISGIFKRQESHLLANVGSLGPNELHRVDELLTAIRSDNVAAFRDALKEAIATFGRHGMNDLDLADMAFNAVSERVLKYAANTAAHKVAIIDNTTGKAVKEGIRKALLDAQIAGDNVTDTAGKIMEAGIQAGFEIRRERAVSIAQTETTSAYNFSDLESWRQSGVVEKKRWNAHSDSKTRETHAEADGQEVNLNEPFQVGDSQMDHPGDPTASTEEVVECRCYLTPVLSRAFRVNRLKAQLQASPSPGASLNGKGMH